jgi:hypothetical protein
MLSKDIRGIISRGCNTEQAIACAFVAIPSYRAVGARVQCTLALVCTSTGDAKYRGKYIILSQALGLDLVDFSQYIRYSPVNVVRWDGTMAP